MTKICFIDTCADATRERSNKKSAECKRRKRTEKLEAKAA